MEDLVVRGLYRSNIVFPFKVIKVLFFRLVLLCQGGDHLSDLLKTISTR